MLDAVGSTNKSIFQLSHTLQVLAAMIATLMICSLSFKELMLKPPPPPEGEQKSFIAKIVHVDNWRNKKFVIWALCVPSALFGYFVPYVHIVSWGGYTNFV